MAKNCFVEKEPAGYQFLRNTSGAEVVAGEFCIIGGFAAIAQETPLGRLCEPAEIARVLKVGAHATFVMGNSCLRDVFIRNSAAVSTAAQHAGLSLVSESERPLPMRSRYLPMTSASLGKRMRTETILTFARA